MVNHLPDLLETNLRQRGIGNTNPIKFARCIQELEKIYGIRQGSEGKRSLDQNNLGLKSQKDLANEVGVTDEQLRNYKKLLTLIPEIQSLIEDVKSSGESCHLKTVDIMPKSAESEKGNFFTF